MVTLSKIGKIPIDVPQGIKVTLKDREIEIEGPKGKLSRKIPSVFKMSLNQGKLSIISLDKSRETKALHGLTRALVANMVKGVSQGFSKDLIIQGVGYKAEVKGKNLVISLGYAHQINYLIPGGIDIVVEKGTKITVKGIDKELVGRVASQLRSFRVPDPYKEKGIKYVGEYIQRKVGKAAATVQTGGKGP